MQIYMNARYTYYVYTIEMHFSECIGMYMQGQTQSERNTQSSESIKEDLKYTET